MAFSNWVNGVEKKLAALVAKRVDASAEDLKRRAQEKTPVDTGEARDGWVVTYEGEGLTRKAIVSNPVPHAAYLEHGTSTQAPVAMLARSIEELKKR